MGASKRIDEQENNFLPACEGEVFGLVTKEAEEAIWQKCREALFAFARIAYSLLLPQRQWKRVLRVSQIWSHPGVRDTEAVAGSMTRQLRQACALPLSHFNFLFFLLTHFPFIQLRQKFFLRDKRFPVPRRVATPSLSCALDSH